MKKSGLALTIFLFSTLTVVSTYGQNDKEKDDAFRDQQKEHIISLIDKYVQARETGDTVLLKSILTNDIDQLVSTGEWRYGIKGAMKGMMQSSARNPGTRTITVEKIRFFNSESGIVDARYEIQNADGTSRKMWSTFLVVYDNDRWKITAIRNMLPAES